MPSKGRASIGAAVALALVACAGIARADGPEPIVVTYEAMPKGCPKENDFKKSVEKRSARAVASTSSSANAIRARVEIDAAGTREIRARVKVTSDDRVVVDRELKGKSCAEAVEASALLVAMFADGDDREPTEETNEEPEPETASRTAGPLAVSAPVANERPVRAKPLDPKRLSFTANPLSLAVSRYSMQVDVMLARHHALTLNPFFVNVKRKYTEAGQAYDLGHQNGLGGEIGYRFYTGDRGPNGFFFGPSFVAARYWADSDEGETKLALSAPQSYSAVGGAFDIGGQVLIGPGIVLGAGVGVQYVHATEAPGLMAWFEGRAGLAPRLLVALGYAF